MIDLDGIRHRDGAYNEAEGTIALDDDYEQCVADRRELLSRVDERLAWEERAVKSMDAASKAAGVTCCDLIPESINILRAQLAEAQRERDEMRELLQEALRYPHKPGNPHSTWNKRALAALELPK